MFLMMHCNSHNKGSEEPSSRRDNVEDVTSFKLLQRHLHPHVLARLRLQLESFNDRDDNEDVTFPAAVVFIVCLMDALHRSLYATFLSQVLFEKLCGRLLPPTVLLQVEFDVYATRWSMSCRDHGSLTWTQPIDWDYDGGATHVLLHHIAGPVMRGHVTPAQGLQRLEAYLERHEGLSRFEKFYRDLPTRIFVIPLMASTCAAVFFDGTWVDFGVAAGLGLMAGLVHLVCSKLVPDLGILQNLIVSTITGMGSVAATTIIGPDQSCFAAQVLGTLYWFLVGTAFVLSLYEVTNQQLSVGVMRYFSALINSVILGFGSILGVWIAAYGGEDRYTVIVGQECKELERKQIEDVWYILLFPLCCIACMMQFKIAPRHWIQCLIVQCVAYLLQYSMLNLWDVSDFAANLFPAFVATLTAQAVVTLEKMIIRWYKATKPEQEEAMYKNVRALPGMQQPSPLTASSETGASQWLEQRQFSNRDRVNNLIAHHNLDLWYCLIPALYLLVPGAALLIQTFSELFDGNNGNRVQATADLGSAVLIIGLAQALGVRFGIVTLQLFRKLWRRMCRGKRSNEILRGGQTPIVVPITPTNSSV